MTLFLRAATPLDAGRTGEILQRFLDDTDWIPNLHSGAETISFCGTMIDFGWMTVAGTDDRVDAFLARDGAEVTALYVIETARGQGLGTALLERAKEAQNRLELWCFQANTPARLFYERHGFVEERRTDGAGNDEKLPDIRFVWVREDLK